MFITPLTSNLYPGAIIPDADVAARISTTLLLLLFTPRDKFLEAELLKIYDGCIGTQKHTV